MALAFSVIFVFVVGAAVGSFLNVVIARLPYEKSLVWPSSRCGACHQAIPWYDNLPLISYLWLRGECRACGQSYSVVYFLVELGTALGFVGLFLLEVVLNVHQWPGHHPWSVSFGFPMLSWLGFWWHALLFSFLLAASVCDLNGREIPLSLSLTGTTIGLIGSAFMPWPMPHTVGQPAFGSRIYQGIYAWPFWHPLPEWCDGGGNWQTGLATGLIGALVGTFLVRAIGFVFLAVRGKEGIGMGDADLLMMAGAFLGWQVVVVGFFLSTIPGLFVGIAQWVAKKDNSLPYGPSISIGVMATSLAWRPIGDRLRDPLFNLDLIIASVVAGGAMLLFLAFAMRIVRGKEEPTA